MAGKKHLVLEDDVYLKLKKRKARTRLSVKAIGNALLRSSLSRAPLPEVIGKKLMEAGKVTPTDYNQALEEALKELQEIANPVSQIIERTSQHSLVSGSWEFRECFRAQNGSFQVLEGWARDRKRKAMPPHVHRESEVIIVLAGSTQLQLETEIQILGPVDSVYIPPGQIHSMVPLTDDVRMVVVTTPAIIEYSQNR